MGEEKAHKQYRGRLAPTPSGFLHEGHVQTFRTVTDRSRANKGRIIFRMDDLDPNRCTEEYASACLEYFKPGTFSARKNLGFLLLTTFM